MTVFLALALPFGLPAADGPVEVRVMSFNIRYGSANDRENSWPNRKALLIETVKTFGPDLLGTQETLGGQRDDLISGLEGYDHLAAGRDDGKEKGEMMALFYKKSRFERLDGGHFWLSETPDVPGSKSWDSSLPRMVTWVKLKDRQAPDAPPVAFFNTHFDHRGPAARLESARLLRRKAAEIGANCRVIVTGDFNAGEGSDPYKALFAPGFLIDSYRHLHPSPSDAEGTYSNFRADSTRGARIDWIAVTPNWTVISAAIDRTAKDGRTPSDHYPVNAVLR